MSQIPKHRKLKRATVLTMRAHGLKNYSVKRSYKPLCEKLRSNNNLLARALSKEKQESQLLFSQNVSLVAEIQNLNLACSKRDAALSNILNSAKEMLKMLVTVTGYVTNTISLCQELTSNGLNIQVSGNSIGKRDSYRRMSAKSPARGVVKPMVSGHTIKKPIINLNRLNMQNFNNPSNLSVIEEVLTPTRNQQLNNHRTPVTPSVRLHRLEPGRPYRMPERLTVSSPRSSEENERRLSKRSSRSSGRLLGRHSKPKSDRVCNNDVRDSAEYAERIGSPRVKLNDVSKLLRNSHGINIRTLVQNQSTNENDDVDNNDEANQEIERDNAITETSANDSVQELSDENATSLEEECGNNASDKNKILSETSSEIQNNSLDWEDPLEGPSWLLDRSQTVPFVESKNVKTNDGNVSNNDSGCRTSSKALVLNDTLNNTEDLEVDATLPMSTERTAYTNYYNTEKLADSDKQCRDSNSHNESGIAPCEDSNKTKGSTETEETANINNFVTQRRGYFECEEEDDDFTLIYRQPRNIHFDINDLKLPVLEESALKRPVINEPEPEITTTVRKISQIFSMPSVSNNTMNESILDKSVVKLPLIGNNEYDKNATLQDKETETLERRKKTKKRSTKIVNFNESLFDKIGEQQKKKKKKKKVANNKDPSAVKVVLEKLNDLDVKLRTPSPEEMYDQDSTTLSSVTSSHVDNSSDSENSNVSSNSACTFERPRRKRIISNFQEPSLRAKLRRNN